MLLFLFYGFAARSSLFYEIYYRLSLIDQLPNQIAMTIYNQLLFGLLNIVDVLFTTGA